MNEEPTEVEEVVEEVDDQFRALLEGLRTTLPGVQVLFAFLLVLPFQSSFSDLSTSEHAAFYIAFATSAVASVLLIAPSVHQRMRAPIDGIRRRTRSHLHVANGIAIAGTIALFVALASVVFLVTSLVLDDTLAVLSVVIVAALTTWAWLYLPLVAFQRDAD